MELLNIETIFSQTDSYFPGPSGISLDLPQKFLGDFPGPSLSLGFERAIPQNLKIPDQTIFFV